MYVSDILQQGLSILFIGFNPGIRSSETGHHFAGPSNRFWRLLAEAGLTPYKLSPEEDRKLLIWGYGITNIVARPTRSASEIKKEEYQAGRSTLAGKLAMYRPGLACYVGIGVYQQFSGRKTIICGLQDQSVLSGVPDYVVSSPSGLNRIPYAEQLYHYQELKQWNDRWKKLCCTGV